VLKGRLGLETARVPHADRHGCIWLRRGHLAVEDGTLRFITAGSDELAAGAYGVPFQTLSTILLEPGTTVSHDALRLLARHGIACVASHTPLDICAGGVNDLLAQKLGLAFTRLTPLIRLCALPKPMTAKALARYISQRLDAPVRYSDADAPIAILAICGGQGCHFLNEVCGHADAFLTGDAGHHDFLDAAQHGLILFAAGHFETEIQIVPALEQRLRAAFPEVQWRIANEYGGIIYA